MQAPCSPTCALSVAGEQSAGSSHLDRHACRTILGCRRVQKPPSCPTCPSLHAHFVGRALTGSSSLYARSGVSVSLHASRPGLVTCTLVNFKYQYQQCTSLVASVTNGRLCMPRLRLCSEGLACTWLCSVCLACTWLCSACLA